MFDYIYLLQTRESYNKDESVFKLGRTRETELKRFNQYPKGSQLKLHLDVLDGPVLEKQLLQLFETKFNKVPQYGNEYFEGSCEEMKATIWQHLFHSGECSHVLETYRRQVQHNDFKLQQLQNTLEQKDAAIRDKDHTIAKLQRMCSELMHELEGREEDGEEEIEQKTYVDKQVTENALAKIIIIENEGGSKSFICSLCNRIFSRKDNLKVHQRKCDGLHPRQCKRCFKMFATRQAKYEHMKNVNCQPPPSSNA